MAAASNFKKGDTIWAVASWDGNGTFRAERLTVLSWGKKQGTATRYTDSRLLERRLYTGEGRGITYIPGDADASAECLAQAAQYLVERRAHFARCRANSNDALYLAAIATLEAELHEPRALLQE